MLIPDNCRTAVSKNTRYETVLNKSYQELAEHYNVAVVPARVRKPDDKSAAEGSVRFVSTWITASLRDRKFFTIGEAKQAVAEKLEELNRRPFKKRPGVTAQPPPLYQTTGKREIICLGKNTPINSNGVIWSSLE